MNVRQSLRGGSLVLAVFCAVNDRCGATEYGTYALVNNSSNTICAQVRYPGGEWGRLAYNGNNYIGSTKTGSGAWTTHVAGTTYSLRIYTNSTGITGGYVEFDSWVCPVGGFAKNWAYPVVGPQLYTNTFVAMNFTNKQALYGEYGFDVLSNNVFLLHTNVLLAPGGSFYWGATNYNVQSNAFRMTVTSWTGDVRSNDGGFYTYTWDVDNYLEKWVFDERIPDYFIKIENLREDLNQFEFIKSFDEESLNDLITNNKFIKIRGIMFNEMYDFDVAKRVYVFYKKHFYMCGYDPFSFTKEILTDDEKISFLHDIV